MTAVVREIRQAHAAVIAMGLDDDNDALVIGETIARNQLMLATGRLAENARLDPEQHDRRGDRC